MCCIVKKLSWYHPRFSNHGNYFQNATTNYSKCLYEHHDILTRFSLRKYLIEIWPTRVQHLENRKRIFLARWCHHHHAVLVRPKQQRVSCNACTTESNVLQQEVIGYLSGSLMTSRFCCIGICTTITIIRLNFFALFKRL